MSESPRADEDFMRAALAYGRRAMGAASPNPAVGALIVRNGVIIARGVTAPGGRPHAETLALAQAGDLARGATLYVTLEPCSHQGATPPCAQAVTASGVSRIVCAIEDPNPLVAGRGIALLREAGREVEVGVCAKEARRDHLGHILRVTQGRPMVTLKLARTLDGFAAGGVHDPRLRITGAVADAHTHMQRLLHDAILVGANTARVDDPLMTVRLPGVAAKKLRVVLDPRLSVSPRSRFAALAHDTPTLLLIGERVGEQEARRFEEQTGAETARVAEDSNGRLDLAAALRALAERGVTRVFCEGGPHVAESLLTQGMVDAAILHTGATPLGRPGLAALSPSAVEALAGLALVDEARLGADRMTRYERAG